MLLYSTFIHISSTSSGVLITYEMQSHSMGANPTTAVSTVADQEIMASVDDDGNMEEFIIADISRDNSWISISLTEAAALPNWR